jgi:hypothetical protein
MFSWLSIMDDSVRLTHHCLWLPEARQAHQATPGPLLFIAEKSSKPLVPIRNQQLQGATGARRGGAAPSLAPSTVAWLGDDVNELGWRGAALSLLH